MKYEVGDWLEKLPRRDYQCKILGIFDDDGYMKYSLAWANYKDNTVDHFTHDYIEDEREFRKIDRPQGIA